MAFSSVAFIVGLLATQVISATPDFPVLINTTSPLTLAVAPACGALNSSTFTEINTGINLSATRTVVAFGDSWTSNGANGTVPVPPILWPPSPSAGSRLTENRRASNGFLWIEDIASSFSAKLLNYAWGGAIIDNLAYNTTSPLNKTGVPRTDFVDEMRLFLLQGKFLDTLTPSQTVYAVAFGINDEGQFEIGGGNWTLASETYITKLGELQANGAKNILIHGMYTSHTNVNILQNQVFAYLRESKQVNGTNFAFVNLQRLFSTISSNPSSFGYTGAATCLLSATSTVGGCSDPDRSVFYIPGHPSQTTHRLISQYTMEVLSQCLV